MGKGTKPLENRVVKPPVSGVLLGGLIADSGPNHDACAIKLKTRVTLHENVAKSVDPGSEFTLIPSESDGLIVFSGNRQIGTYKGKRSADLKRCMDNGYIYGGKVLSVDNNQARCLVGVIGVRN